MAGKWAPGPNGKGGGAASGKAKATDCSECCLTCHGCTHCEGCDPADEVNCPTDCCVPALVTVEIDGLDAAFCAECENVGTDCTATGENDTFSSREYISSAIDGTHILPFIGDQGSYCNWGDTIDDALTFDCHQSANCTGGATRTTRPIDLEVRRDANDKWILLVPYKTGTFFDGVKRYSACCDTNSPVGIGFTDTNVTTCADASVSMACSSNCGGCSGSGGNLWDGGDVGISITVTPCD